MNPRSPECKRMKFESSADFKTVVELSVCVYGVVTTAVNKYFK
jgi:hypothetical protein